MSMCVCGSHRRVRGRALHKSSQSPSRGYHTAGEPGCDSALNGHWSKCSNQWKSCTGGPRAFAIKADKLVRGEMEGTSWMCFFLFTEIDFIFFFFGQRLHDSVGVFILSSKELNKKWNKCVNISIWSSTACCLGTLAALAALSRHSRTQFLILEEIAVSIVARKSQEEEKEGKQECSPLRGDHKEPSYAINPSPPAVWYHRAPVTVSFPPFSPLQQPKEWLGEINTHAEPKHAPNVPFLPFFSQQHASTTDGEFLRHETRRVSDWLTGEWKEKEKEHNQIPAAELNSVRLDGAVPRAKCGGGNWARAEVGFAGPRRRALCWSVQVGDGRLFSVCMTETACVFLC